MDEPVEEVTEPEVPTIGRNVAPVPANPGEPAEDINEPLPRGDDIRGGVRFVTITHADTGGTQDVPEHLVAHWASKGWAPADGTVELVDDPATVVLEELGDLIDDEPTTVAPTGDDATTPQFQED